MDTPRLSELKTFADANLAEIQANGLVNRNRQLQGKAQLLYSPSQHVATRTYLAKSLYGNEGCTKTYNDPTKRESLERNEKAGQRIALDIESGNVVHFTDMLVLEGNEDLIKYQLRTKPGLLLPPERLSLPNYKDVQDIATVNPANLITLTTLEGTRVNHIYVDRRQNGSGSFVGYYGPQRAIEILAMLAQIPDDLKPGIYDNSTNKYVEIDDLLAAQGDIGRLVGNQVPDYLREHRL